MQACTSHKNLHRFFKMGSIQPNLPSFFALIANLGAENKLKKDRRITLTWAILAVDK